MDGHLWRAEPTITPFLVSLCPSASIAFNAAHPTVQAFSSSCTVTKNGKVATTVA